MQKDSIQYGEYGCGCADSQREGEDGKEGKTRCSAQAAQRVLYVAEKFGEQVPLMPFDFELGRGCHDGLISTPAVPACD